MRSVMLWGRGQLGFHHRDHIPERKASLQTEIIWLSCPYALVTYHGKNMWPGSKEGDEVPGS